MQKMNKMNPSRTIIKKELECEEILYRTDIETDQHYGPDK